MQRPTTLSARGSTGFLRLRSVQAPRSYSVVDQPGVHSYAKNKCDHHQRMTFLPSPSIRRGAGGGGRSPLPQMLSEQCKNLLPGVCARFAVVGFALVIEKRVCSASLNVQVEIGLASSLQCFAKSLDLGRWDALIVFSVNAE